MRSINVWISRFCGWHFEQQIYTFFLIVCVCGWSRVKKVRMPRLLSICESVVVNKQCFLEHMIYNKLPMEKQWKWSWCRCKSHRLTFVFHHDDRRIRPICVFTFVWCEESIQITPYNQWLMLFHLTFHNSNRITMNSYERK